jgi:hypothetical protein
MRQSLRGESLLSLPRRGKTTGWSMRLGLDDFGLDGEFCRGRTGHWHDPPDNQLLALPAFGSPRATLPLAIRFLLCPFALKLPAATASGPRRRAAQGASRVARKVHAAGGLVVTDRLTLASGGRGGISVATTGQTRPWSGRDPKPPRWHRRLA